MRDERPKQKPGYRGPPEGWRRSDDPMEFVKPGDHPELDALLKELKADCDEGDPLFVNYAKRRRERAAKRTRSETAAGTLEAPRRARELQRSPAQAKDARTGGNHARRRGMSWRLVAALALTMAAPIVTLGLVWLLRERPERPAAIAGRSTMTAAGTGTDTYTGMATGTATGTGTDMDTDTATGAGTAAAAVTGSPSAAPSSSPRALPARAKTPSKSDEDPYAPTPQPTGSADASRAPAPGQEKGSPPSSGSDFF